MCVNISKYPLVELFDGKKKVLFTCGEVVENRDFIPFDELASEWRLGRLGLSKFNYINSACKKYDIKQFLKYVSVPCGICEDCLKSRARGWAFRILKEAELYENNYFISFDYNDEHLPMSSKGFPTLDKYVISWFNKKLKNHLRDKNLDSTFRFYAVGEYGDRTCRPHYHVIYFNLPLFDLKFHYIKDGNPFFTSEFLNSLWVDDNGSPIGHVDIGLLGVGSACYVARYCDKKQNRSKQEKELISKFCLPEFSNMSRRPGIGAYYLDKLKSDLEKGIFKLYCNSNEFGIPIYYSRKIKELVSDDVLLNLEKHNELLIKKKFNNDLLLSDVISTDLQSFYNKENLHKKSCKKLRDNLYLY